MAKCCGSTAGSCTCVVMEGNQGILVTGSGSTDDPYLISTTDIPFSDAWETFPTIWGGAVSNPVLNDGTLIARTLESGKLIFFDIVITMAATTTYGSGEYSLTLPGPIRVGDNFTFVGSLRDASASAEYVIYGKATGGSTISLKIAGSPLGSLTGTSPVTLATDDVISINGVYERS